MENQVKTKTNCKHESQSYTRVSNIFGCEEWNTCNKCKAKLLPDIWKAEERKKLLQTLNKPL